MNEKGRWQRAVNLRYLTIFCIVEICFLALLYTAWQYNRNSYLANRSSHLQTVAEAIITRSEAVAHAIAYEIIQQPNILNLFEKAGTATELQRQATRRDLHNKLINTYQRLQQKRFFVISSGLMAVPVKAELPGNQVCHGNHVFGISVAPCP